MTEIEIAWLAGLLEGEGSFNLQCSKYPVGIWLHMTDEDVVAKACVMLGTKYHKMGKRKEHWKDSYKTGLRGRRAIEIMKQILPYMGQRRTLKLQDCINSFCLHPQGIPKTMISEIRQRFQNGEKPKEIAKDYPITYWRVYQLVRDLRTNASMM